LTQGEAELQELRNKRGNAKIRLDLASELYEEAKRTTKNIETSLDSAATSAIAQASGGGQFGGGGSLSQSPLNSQTAAHISGAVQAIVQTALSKNYTGEQCLALLSRQNAGYDDWSDDAKDQYNEARKLCMGVLAEAASAKLLFTSLSKKQTYVKAFAELNSKNREVTKKWLDTNEQGKQPGWLIQFAPEEILDRFIEHIAPTQ
jgi:hypothetical protein